ncbi:hypothetical protein Glove_386g14 [Diversispora epigaea]|uniref:Uncharacterized protein n=1 Tax=Diversispora epigaea TaxID=1348612 RepID=A0A397H787_9GLOM|nr:hypothetical protein Glove_386g14 [Diversispora epigaea]
MDINSDLKNNFDSNSSTENSRKHFSDELLEGNTENQTGSKVTVHLDMDKRRCSLIINKKPIHLGMVSSKLYPIATLR